MNRVVVSAEEVPLPLWSGAVSRFALKALDGIKRDNWELSILLCGDKTITALNSRYRGKDEATDVLSFSMGAESQDEDGTYFLPGDIVISLDTLHENARYFQISEDEELRRLLIHGILHLDGMDHKSEDSAEPMIALQEDLLNKLKDERIFPRGGEE
ncbi:MAG: rRNA maturation RNase YbeY [Treponema sp.]|jgi:probable rRNA maturation factor|nr:rRNA maturation RNase YbeY [Treponema sp.]